MNATPKVRNGNLVVYVKYSKKTEGRNKLPSTISINCYLSEVQSNVSSIVNVYGAQYYTKVTFNSRPVILN